MDEDNEAEQDEENSMYKDAADQQHGGDQSNPEYDQDGAKKRDKLNSQNVDKRNS